MEPFKNKISPDLVACLAMHIERHLEGFDRKSYEASILTDLDKLELKQRARLIADVTGKVLPQTLDGKFHILKSVLHPLENEGVDRASDEQGIRGWGMMPLGMVVTDVT